MLPPGAEDVLYKNYRLEVRHHGSGFKIFVFPPGSMVTLLEIPQCLHQSEREALIARAKALVDIDAPKRQR